MQGDQEDRIILSVTNRPLLPEWNMEHSPKQTYPDLFLRLMFTSFMRSALVVTLSRPGFPADNISTWDGRRDAAVLYNLYEFQSENSRVMVPHRLQR